MRIDKYLKITRIIKRRTIANEACDAGRIYVNDKVVKASYNVNVNDIIEIHFGNNKTKIKVLDIKQTIKKEEVNKLFEYII